MKTVITGGTVFDGTGAAPSRGDVVIEGDRIVEVLRGGHMETRVPHEGEHVIDATGCTVMPGLIESHAHLTFPSAVGHLDTSFNPPLDVSFFHHIEGFPTELARAERNARILLDAGFTSAYSAGSIIGMPTEIALRDKIAAGVVPGPRLRACSAERDGRAERPGGPEDPAWRGPDAVAGWVHGMAAQGYDTAKLLLSNDDVFLPGGSQMTVYTEAEAMAAGAAAKATGIRLAAHCQAAAAVKLAVKAGFRSIFHCSHADTEALDLLESVRDTVFVSPAVGIIWANVHNGDHVGITREVAEQMGSVSCLERFQELYPKIRERGIRVLPGGDYGFPNNPIGENARDLRLFVELLGFTPTETLVAATKHGGELMGLDVGVLTPGFLADVLVVAGNPVDDISLLEHPHNLRTIIQGGRVHKAAA
jgi:imidazolonepropionase-like amidohydrolase